MRSTVSQHGKRFPALSQHAASVQSSADAIPEAVGATIARVLTRQRTELEQLQALQAELDQLRAQTARGYQRVANALLRERLNRGKFKEVAAAAAKILRGRDRAPISHDQLAAVGGFSKSTARRGMAYLVQEAHALELVEQGGYGRIPGTRSRSGGAKGAANVYAVTALWLAWFPESRAQAQARAQRLATLETLSQERAQIEHPTWVLPTVEPSTPPSPLQGGGKVSASGEADGAPVASGSLSSSASASPDLDGTSDGDGTAQEDKVHPLHHDVDTVTAVTRYLDGRKYDPETVTLTTEALAQNLCAGRPIRNPYGWADRMAHRVQLRRDAERANALRTVQAEEASRAAAAAAVQDNANAYRDQLLEKSRAGGRLLAHEATFLRSLGVQVEATPGRPVEPAAPPRVYAVEAVLERQGRPLVTREEKSAREAAVDADLSALLSRAFSRGGGQ